MHAIAFLDQQKYIPRILSIVNYNLFSESTQLLVGMDGDAQITFVLTYIKRIQRKKYIQTLRQMIRKELKRFGPET